MNAPDLPSPMCTAALQYARRGWKVFPCRERDGESYIDKNGKDRTPLAKQPYIARGFHGGTLDETQIKRWWRQWPEAMIGLVMGDNAMFAVDFDPRIDPVTGEVFTLETLKAATEAQMGSPMPVSLASRTPSGGVHVFYKQPPGEPIGNKGSLPQHVDVRGKGGYVVAPPSYCYGGVKASEGRYRWIEGRQDTPAVDAPPELLEVLRERAKRAPAKDARRRKTPPTASSSPRTPAAALADVSDTVRKYALSALDGECRELAATPIGGGRWGGRNNGIYHAALKMGALVGVAAISESVVRAAIQGVIDGMPSNDDPDGATKTMDNGLRDGQASPRDLSEIEAAARARADRPRRSQSAGLRPPPPPPTDGEALQSFRVEGKAPDADVGGGGDGDADDADDEIMRGCVFRPHTDLGNAERFLLRYGRDFRWSPALGWLGWDGRRWAQLDDDAGDKNSVPAEVMDAIYKTVRAIQDEGEYVAMTGIKDPGLEYVDSTDWTICERKNYEGFIETGRRDDALDYVSDARGYPRWSDIIRKWGRTTEAAGKIAAIAKLARPKLAIRVAALDTDPFAFNCLNGTLRFRRVRVDGKWKSEQRFHPHRREDLISKLAPIEYDPEATCPIYDENLSWAQPKGEVRRYLHQWGGYSMSADVSEQKLQYWYGLGGNMKSTVMDAWCQAYGDYSDTIGIESFLDQGIKKRGDQASPDLAKLAGVRLLRTSEPDEGGKLATGLIKLVTGGEPVPVRHLNRGFFNMKVMFKLTVSGNHKPEIRQTDDGIWRRIKLVFWGQRVRDPITNPTGTREKDLELLGKLATELSGIFNHLVAGLRDWLENGLVEPEDVTRDTVAYRTENDPLAKFLRLCTVPDQEATARSSKLYELFVAWCKVADETEWKQKGFSRAMLAKGYQKKQSDGMHWLGIRMVRTPDEFVDDHGRPKAFSLPDEDDGGPPPPTPPPMAGEDWGNPDAGFDPDDEDWPL